MNFLAKRQTFKSDQQSTYAPELPLNYQLKADELVTTPFLTHAVVYELLRLPSMVRFRFEVLTSIRKALFRDLPYHAEGSEEFQTLLVALGRVYKVAELSSVKTSLLIIAFIKNYSFLLEVQSDLDSCAPIAVVPLE